MEKNTDCRWLSCRELAHRFGLPVETLAQWDCNGTGPPYGRMGRHARYRISDVIDWDDARVDDNVSDSAQPATLATHEPKPDADAGIPRTGPGDGGNQQ